MTHKPVLTKEVLKYLRPRAGDFLVDATFGSGGHTKLLLPAVGASGRVIGIDRDPQALDRGTHRFAAEIKKGRLLLIEARFSELANVLQEIGQPEVKGVLMDLGVSLEQLTSPTRGFSFEGQAPLDMRLDQREDFTAARLLADWTEFKLRNLFFEIGERTYAARLAHAIVLARKKEPLKTTDQLVQLISQVIPIKVRLKRTTHVATKVFLALRIAVNYELAELERGLEAAIHILSPGGRLVVISFHSLEDQIVKRTFKRWASDCICPPELPICGCGHRRLVKILTPHPLLPDPTELARNPRSRSAKLRSCERL